MPWVVDDVCGCDGQKVGNSGEFRNPSFPTDVAVGEAWTGTINAYNAGTLPDTFRYRVGDQVMEGFPLQAGETKTLPIYGTGPANFWMYLDRQVGVGPDWVKWIKAHWLPLTVLSTWGVGMVAVGVAVK